MWYFYQIFWSPLRKLFKNPMTLFIYTIVSKWYMIMVITCLVTTYWVFKGLKDIGAIDAAEKILIQAVNDTKSVAKNCTPLLTNPKAFFDCASNPPRYEPTDIEVKLQDDMMKDLEQTQKEKDALKSFNPYLSNDENSQSAPTSSY